MPYNHVCSKREVEFKSVIKKRKGRGEKEGRKKGRTFEEKKVPPFEEREGKK